MGLRAVTFDFWNTLVSEDGTIVRHRRDTWLRLLHEAGHDEISAERIQAAFLVAWDRYVVHWTAGNHITVADAGPWAFEELGLDPDPALRAALIKAYGEPPPHFRPPLTPNIAECLAALRAGGMHIGIICDVGMTPSTILRRYLDEHGILQYFDHWSFSDEVGVYKPDPVIFTHALNGLRAVAGDDLQPGEIAHVGDLRRTDVAGSLAFGNVAVRYTGIFDDPGDAGHGTDGIDGNIVIGDHADLPAALGIA